MKRLILLDLDNTLIYSDISNKLKVNLLCKYLDFLYVYERPYAREFIQQCHEIGEVMVFTMAEWEYAVQVTEHLNIQPSRIYSNDDCLIREGMTRKSLPDHYYQTYDQIIIVDDCPEIWEIKNNKLCYFFAPVAFTGDKKDTQLKLLTNKLIEFKNQNILVVSDAEDIDVYKDPATETYLSYD